jgi:hypothetical protein
VSKTIIDMMWTYNPNVDYRVTVYANTPAAGGYWEGMPNGLTSSKALAYKGNGLSKTSKIGDFFTAPESPGVLMSYAELQFILAEGVERGLITGGKTAEEYYTEGIYGSYNQYADALVANSFDYFGVADTIAGIHADWTADTYAADYMENGGGAWDAGSALEKIMTEKWLAMFEQGLQSRFEWVRTGFPVLVAGADAANGGVIPVRFPFPTDEYATNPANVKAAVADQGTDDLNTRIWWAK